MKKLYKKTVRTDMGLMIVTVSVLGVVSLAACSINYNDLADGINDLGKSVDHAINGTDAATAAATSGTETDATDPTAAPTEPEATPTPSPTPVPTATPTPTPTPTPAPQRVDMSELTTDTITEGVEIKDETFEESYHDVDDYTQLVKFTGNRIAVEIPDGKNVQTAINLVINGFYNETEGLYKRYSDEAQSAYLLDKENYLAAPYSVNVKFNYSYNGRSMKYRQSASLPHTSRHCLQAVCLLPGKTARLRLFLFCKKGGSTRQSRSGSETSSPCWPYPWQALNCEKEDKTAPQ